MNKKLDYDKVFDEITKTIDIINRGGHIFLKHEVIRTLEKLRISIAKM